MTALNEIPALGTLDSNSPEYVAQLDAGLLATTQLKAELREQHRAFLKSVPENLAGYLQGQGIQDAPTDVQFLSIHAEGLEDRVVRELSGKITTMDRNARREIEDAMTKYQRQTQRQIWVLNDSRRIATRLHQDYSTAALSLTKINPIVELDSMGNKIFYILRGKRVYEVSLRVPVMGEKFLEVSEKGRIEGPRLYKMVEASLFSNPEFVSALAQNPDLKANVYVVSNPCNELHVDELFKYVLTTEVIKLEEREETMLGRLRPTPQDRAKYVAQDIAREFGAGHNNAGDGIALPSQVIRLRQWVTRKLGN